MKTRVAAALAAVLLGIAAPASSALAFSYDAPRGHYMGFAPYQPPLPGSFDDRNPVTCPMSSAAEGNANQQNFPVKQYGQTTGGNRC